MKKKKVLLCGILAFLLLFGSACENEDKVPVDADKDDSPENIVEVDTEYEDFGYSPDYFEISDSVEYQTYYFDSKVGSDENDGLSQNAPKQSLEEINRLILEVTEETPVKFLIKAGSEYEGQLYVAEFEASEEAPLIIDTYAASDNNKYAKIVGLDDSSCVVVGNSNVRISGLECTGQKTYRGIEVKPVMEGVMENVVISGNYCHDLNFDVSNIENGLSGLPELGTAPSDAMLRLICPDERYSYQSGGIIAEANTPKWMGASWFENFWIENNIIERVARTGIWVFSNWTYRPGCDWGNNPYYSDEVNYYPHHNVTIRNNYISHAGGDSIVMGAVDGGYIEGNTSMYAQYLGRPGFYNAGIWTHSCKNIVFQKNEAAYTYMQNGAGDGEGFDIDIGCSDIIFQYNYSHHNEGGGILMCNHSTWLVKYDENGEYIRDADGLPTRENIAPYWTDVTIRNNVFADNGGSVIVCGGYVNNFHFENNTVVIPGNSDLDKILTSHDLKNTGLPGEGWVLQNNIFISRGGHMATFDTSFSQGCTFDSNVFWNFPDTFEESVKNEHGEDMRNFILADPGISLDTLAENGLVSMNAFKPSGTEMLKGALSLEKMSLYDAEGVDATGKQYFGAYSTGK